MKTVELKLKRKLHEVFVLEPNDLGFNFLTRIYKSVTVYLKTMPFILIAPISVAIGIILYFILDHLLVGLVSLLQYGF